MAVRGSTTYPSSIWSVLIQSAAGSGFRRWPDAVACAASAPMASASSRKCKQQDRDGGFHGHYLVCSGNARAVDAVRATRMSTISGAGMRKVHCKVFAIFISQEVNGWDGMLADMFLNHPRCVNLGTSGGSATVRVTTQ